MAEVSAPSAQIPADRSVSRPGTDNPTRTGGSVPFRSLLRSPVGGPILARRPASAPARLIIAQSGPEPAPQAPQGRARRDPEARLEPETKPAPELALDPLLCQLALNPGVACFVQANPASSTAAAALPLREDLQNLLTGLARRAAWGGDRRKGSARIELSEGALAGATLVVHAEQRSVSVELELPSGVAAAGWQQRIAERLEARGFTARVKVG